MKRFKEKTIFSIEPSDNGDLVYYADVLEMVRCTFGFVYNHKEDIQNGEGDFGALKPLLEMIRGTGNS
jgi:hypothetical protein